MLLGKLDFGGISNVQVYGPKHLPGQINLFLLKTEVILDIFYMLKIAFLKCPCNSNFWGATLSWTSDLKLFTTLLLAAISPPLPCHLKTTAVLLQHLTGISRQKP